MWLRAGTLLATVGPVKHGKTDSVPSWGSMLQEASNVVSIADFPWALAPAGAIILVALAFNLIVQGPAQILERSAERVVVLDVSYGEHDGLEGLDVRS